MGLCGKAEGHCCWFKGEECRYVTRDASKGFKWACSLRTKYGSWEKVHKSREYRGYTRKRWHEVGLPENLNCGDWPGPGVKCNECGEVG